MPSEPQLPDIPLDDLPGGQPVDPRTFHALHQYIKDALDEGRAVFLNDLQCDLLITYARHAVRQHIPMLSTLAAGAYHAFRTRGVAPENEALYQKLGRRDEIVRLEERFRSKLATSFDGSAPPSSREVPAEQRGKNYIAAMQASLRQGNYDYAADMAELGLGVAGGLRARKSSPVLRSAFTFEQRKDRGGSRVSSRTSIEQSNSFGSSSFEQRESTSTRGQGCR